MRKHEKITRREFLGTSGLAVGAVAALPALPPAEMERLRHLLSVRRVVLDDFFAHHHDGFTA
jgi:hypothetical protein